MIFSGKLSVPFGFLLLSSLMLGLAGCGSSGSASGGSVIADVPPPPPPIEATAEAVSTQEVAVHEPVSATSDNPAPVLQDGAETASPPAGDSETTASQTVNPEAAETTAAAEAEQEVQPKDVPRG